MITDKLTAKKLTTDQVDALRTASHNAHGRIAARVKIDGAAHDAGVQAHSHLFDLAKIGLLKSFLVDDSGGTVDVVYVITPKGKRVIRQLPELSTIWIKIAPNAGTEEPHWIAVDNFDVDSLERSRSIIEKFYMLKPHIPEGFHPTDLARSKSAEVAMV